LTLRTGRPFPPKRADTGGFPPTPPPCSRRLPGQAHTRRPIRVHVQNRSTHCTTPPNPGHTNRSSRPRGMGDTRSHRSPRDDRMGAWRCDRDQSDLWPEIPPQLRAAALAAAGVRKHALEVAPSITAGWPDVIWIWTTRAWPPATPLPGMRRHAHVLPTNRPDGRLREHAPATRRLRDDDTQ
jgi:hypothetical protein